MIVDVHTHLPPYKDAVPADVLETNTKWRPDRPVQIPVSWDDYLEAQKPADVSIVFHIARMDEEGFPDHSWYEGTPLPKVDPEAIEAIIHCDALALLGLG